MSSYATNGNLKIIGFKYLKHLLIAVVFFLWVKWNSNGISYQYLQIFLEAEEFNELIVPLCTNLRSQKLKAQQLFYFLFVALVAIQNLINLRDQFWCATFI